MGPSDSNEARSIMRCRCSRGTSTPSPRRSAVETYAPDAAGPKGSGDGEEMLYCQVALEKNETLFIDDPAKFPGLEKNEDFVKFGYGYYIGAPWRQRGGGALSGTIAVMEKVAGKFKPEHVATVEVAAAALAPTACSSSADPAPRLRPQLFRDLFEQDISEAARLS